MLSLHVKNHLELQYWLSVTERIELLHCVLKWPATHCSILFLTDGRCKPDTISLVYQTMQCPQSWHYDNGLLPDDSAEATVLVSFASYKKLATWSPVSGLSQSTQTASQMAIPCLFGSGSRAGAWLMIRSTGCSGCPLVRLWLQRLHIIRDVCVANLASTAVWAMTGTQWSAC